MRRCGEKKIGEGYRGAIESRRSEMKKTFVLPWLSEGRREGEPRKEDADSKLQGPAKFENWSQEKSWGDL